MVKVAFVLFYGDMIIPIKNICYVCVVFFNHNVCVSIFVNSLLFVRTLLFICVLVLKTCTPPLSVSLSVPALLVFFCMFYNVSQKKKTHNMHLFLKMRRRLINVWSTLTNNENQCAADLHRRDKEG